MPAIELDMLIAFVNAADSLHPVADRLFRKVARSELRGYYVPSSAYLEYQLIRRARGAAQKAIASDVRNFADHPNLTEEALTSEVIVNAGELRQKHNLSFFDSLHAATAMLADAAIMSVDAAYRSVAGLKWLDPREIRDG